MTILDEIAADTRVRVREQIAAVPLAEMRRRADATPRPDRFPFERALAVDELSFIAEVKKASPSAGVIARRFPYLDISAEYERAGAAAISVLTEPHFFQGSDDYLTEIAAARAIPVLRKDFVVDEYQIVQARALGAAAVLLIVALLDDDELRRFLALTEELGLSALVEVHDESETCRALAAGARVIGVNNRDLHSFIVDPGTTERLAALIPSDVLLVAESGVSDPATVRRLRDAGVDAILVGEALMRSADKTAALRGLRANLTQIKICGLMTPDDVAAVNASPPDFAGFVFAPESSRRITPDKAAELRSLLRPSIASVGVFVDADPAMIAELASAGVIEMVQLHGHETDANIAAVKQLTGLPVIKGMRTADPDPATPLASLATRRMTDFWAEACVKSGAPSSPSSCAERSEVAGSACFPSADYVLLDSTAGSGKRFDWNAIPPLGRPFFLAGGITTANITEALTVPGVIGVDISSGAQRDGHKDPELIHELVRATRSSAVTTRREH